MSDRIVLAATVAAAVFAIAGLAAASMNRLILGGTLLLFTAFSIYIRETHK